MHREAENINQHISNIMLPDYIYYPFCCITPYLQEKLDIIVKIL